MDKKSPSGEVPHEITNYAQWLDSKFSIPNTRFRFGIDPILGLIPGIGDVLGFLLGGGLVLMASRKGASGKLLALMSLNLFLDTIVGSIPILGGIFDFFYKANQVNVRLLKNHYQKGKYEGSGKGVIVGVLLGILVLAVLVVFIIWKLLEWIYQIVV